MESTTGTTMYRMAKRSVLVMLFALQLLYPFMGCFDQLYDLFRYTGKTLPHGYEMNLT